MKQNREQSTIGKQEDITMLGNPTANSIFTKVGSAGMADEHPRQGNPKSPRQFPRPRPLQQLTPLSAIADPTSRPPAGRGRRSAPYVSPASAKLKPLVSTESASSIGYFGHNFSPYSCGEPRTFDYTQKMAEYYKQLSDLVDDLKVKGIKFRKAMRKFKALKSQLMKESNTPEEIGLIALQTMAKTRDGYQISSVLTKPSVKTKTSMFSCMGGERAKVVVDNVKVKTFNSMQDARKMSYRIQGIIDDIMTSFSKQQQQHRGRRR